MAVKVCRLKLIEALKNSKQKIISEQTAVRNKKKSETKRYNDDLKKYDDEMKEWRDGWKAVAPQNAKNIFIEITEGHRTGDYPSVTVRYDLKIGSKIHRLKVYCDGSGVPQKPCYWDYDTRIEEKHNSKLKTIDNHIKLLEMSDEEKVSTSTYKNLVEFI